MCKITAFLSAKGLCSFNQADRLIVFSKSGTGWIQQREIKLPMKPPASIREQRQRIEQLLSQIDDSRILVGQEISGIPYVVFDQAHFHVFQISKLSDEFFDAVVREVQSVESRQKATQKKFEHVAPEKTKQSGIYQLDLIKVQQDYPEITSKQALMDFLSKTSFGELHLHCRHTPPWIERDRRFTIEKRPAEHHEYIVVRPK
ncbi:MAG: Fe-only nitrogenase accessory AnfO family protein [Sporolactobacillus sp.]